MARGCLCGTLRSGERDLDDHRQPRYAHASSTRRPCYPMARCSSQAELSKWLPHLLSRARNSTIRRWHLDCHRQSQRRTLRSHGDLAAQRQGARRRRLRPPRGTLVSAELYDPASGTWTATGNLATARSFHTATLLPNGQVLVAGGGGDLFPFYRASAELYDPAAGTWTATGSLATGREVHTATLLPNGQVLVAGGFGVQRIVLASAELYDPGERDLGATAASPPDASYHTATLLPNGNVLAAGRSGARRPWRSRERGTIPWASNTAHLAQHLHAHAGAYRRPGADRWLHDHRNRSKEGPYSRDRSFA